MVLVCANNVCHNTDMKSEVIKCNGFCKKDFHGLCLNLERGWSNSRLKDNFICDDCINMLINGNNVNDKYFDKVNVALEETASVLHKNMSALNSNSEILKEFMDNIENNEIKVNNNVLSDRLEKIFLKDFDILKNKVDKINFIENLVNSLTNKVSVFSRNFEKVENNLTLNNSILNSIETKINYLVDKLDAGPSNYNTILKDLVELFNKKKLMI